MNIGPFAETISCPLVIYIFQQIASSNLSERVLVLATTTVEPLQISIADRMHGVVSYDWRVPVPLALYMYSYLHILGNVWWEKLQQL